MRGNERNKKKSRNIKRVEVCSGRERKRRKEERSQEI